MEGRRLMEYRPGRYCWADEMGKVIRKVTDKEADAELARLFAKENAGGAGCAPPGRPSSESAAIAGYVYHDDWVLSWPRWSAET